MDIRGGDRECSVNKRLQEQTRLICFECVCKKMGEDGMRVKSLIKGRKVDDGAPSKKREVISGASRGFQKGRRIRRI